VLTALVNSPFLPPEWLTAHGFSPRPPAATPPTAIGEGRCALAQAMRAAAATTPADVLVWASACDQLRRAGDELPSDRPTFRCHVPVAWQGPAAFACYADELHRLGRFLVAHGGKAPTPEILAAELAAWEARRQHLRELRNMLPDKEYARRFLDWPGAAAAPSPSGGVQSGILIAQRSLECGAPAPLSLASEAHSVESQSDTQASLCELRRGTAGVPHHAHRVASSKDACGVTSGIPLALLGGALTEHDLPLFDAIGRAGGTVVLNATDNGEMAIPEPVDPGLSAEDPFTAMAEAHFRLPAVFRRPDDALYSFLDKRLAERQVRGLVVHRQPWCDLWHAVIPRLRERFGLPLLDLEATADPTPAHARNRLAAFTESLRCHQDDFSARATRGSRKKFVAALAQVPDREPDDGDQL